MMIVYAIRHKPTGHYIPNPGGSDAEPCPSDEVLPKLFKKPGHAKGWLTTWLKGIIRPVSTQHGQLFGDEDDWVMKTIPVLSRKRDDMEIVILQIKEFGVLK